MNRELVTGLAQLSAEKGLPKEVVSDIIARAIKRAYGDEEHIDVKVDVQTGAFRVYLLKTVVEKVEDPKIQVQLDTAKKIKPDAQLGDVIPFEESAAALGRIGAQTAKQVIQQSLREAEREQVFAEYADREGDIINAKISHFDAGSAIMELDRGATAILPRSEQAPHERYFAGQARKVVVLEVRRTLRGPQIIVSRAHKALVKRLFELEVPEIFHGQVEIVGIAREPGALRRECPRTGARRPGGYRPGREDRLRHRSRPSAVAGDRQGRPERTPRRETHRLADRHPERIRGEGGSRAGARAGAGGGSRACARGGGVGDPSRSRGRGRSRVRTGGRGGPG